MIEAMAVGLFYCKLMLVWLIRVGFENTDTFSGK